MAKKSNKQDRFAVWVPCKGYVKRWLLANFNRPDEYWQELVNLSPNREFADDFKKRLTRAEARRDSSVKGRYTTRVAIEITYDTFQRYGWELTPTETLRWNTKMESEVKQVLHTYNAMLSVTGLSIADRITATLKQACSTMRLYLIDHVVVTDSTYYSYSEEGKL